MPLKQIINEIFETEFQKSAPNVITNLAEATNALAIDIYSENKRFVFELIQNADDAVIDGKSVSVKLQHIDEYLIVSHTGKTFSERDVRGICGIGYGTKQNDPYKTGYKGIGFKSVFGQQAGWVCVKSGDEYFAFDKNSEYWDDNLWGSKKEWEEKYERKFQIPWQLVPIYLGYEELPKTLQNKKLFEGFTVSTIIKVNKPEKLEEDIWDLLSSPELVLFLRNVDHIDFESGRTRKIEKRNGQKTGLTELWLDGEINSVWLITKKLIAVDELIKEKIKSEQKSPDKLLSIEKTEVSFAAKINLETERIEPLKPGTSQILTYLPTKVTTFNLPILCNGNFLLDAGREYFHEDREWNKWVFEKLGIEIFRWIKEVGENPQFRPQIIDLLPPIPDRNSGLKTAFAKGIEKGLNDIAFLPGRRRLLKAAETLIDFTGLTKKDFVPLSSLIEFINLTHEKHFTEESILDSGLEKVKRLEKYGVFLFEPKHLKDFFLSEIFLENHSIEENFNLITYFFEQAKRRKQWDKDLVSIPFIFDQNAILRSPKDIFFEAGEDLDADAYFIHPDTYTLIESQTELKDWLEELGISVASNENFVRKVILDSEGENFGDENAIHYIQLLYKSYKAGEISETELSNAKNLKLITSIGSLKKANECYLSKCYQPQVNLEGILEEDLFVSKEYPQKEIEYKEWGVFLVKIGVKERLEVRAFSAKRISELQDKFEIDFLTSLVDSNVQSNNHYLKQYPHLFRTSNSISGLKQISFINRLQDNSNFSVFFWDSILNNSNILPNDLNSSIRIPFGYYGSSTIVNANYVEWLITNRPVLPCTDGLLYEVDKIFENKEELHSLSGNYLPVFCFTLSPESEWKSFLRLKNKFTIPDLLFVLECISNVFNDKGSVEKADVKRVHDIFIYFLSEYDYLELSQKNELTEWGNNQKVLTNSNNFSLPKEIYFYQNEASINIGDSYELISTNPEIRRHEFAEPFFKLLGVKIINEENFTLNLINNKYNEELTKRFIHILPWLIVLAREKDNLERTFERLIEKIQACDFYVCDEIDLTFEEKTIRKCRALFQKKEDSSSLYFKDKWNSRLTLMELPGELCELLDISKKWGREVQFLLTANDSEIKEWVGETLGEELLETIESSPVWQRIKEIYPHEQVVPKSNVTTGITSTVPVPVPGIGTTPIGGSIPIPEKPETLEDKVKAARKSLLEECNASNDLTLGWLRLCLEYEYLSKINQNQKNKRIRFKTVKYEDGWLILTDPDAETIDPELYYLKDTNPNAIELKIRNPRKKGVSISNFRIAKIEEFEIWCKVDSIQFPFSDETTATITLPADDFLLQMLKKQLDGLFSEKGISNKDYIHEYFAEKIPAQGIQFLFGPPGTGKTTTISKRVLNTLEGTEGKKILILTPTNRAADVVIEKIYSFILPEKKHLNDRVFRLDGHSKDFNTNQPHSFIVATTIHRYLFDSFGNGTSIQNVDWDFLIFDEASMLPLPYLLNTLFRFDGLTQALEDIHSGLSSPCLISGDPFQILPVGLTPTFPDLIETNENLKGWSTENIYSLLGIDKFYLTSSPKANPYHIERLMTQYRSFPSIGRFFGRYLYTDENGGEILQHDKKEDESIFSIKGKQLNPLSFFQFDFKLPSDRDDQDVLNVYEFGVAKYHIYSAILATKIAFELANAYPEKSIAIVSPYSRQAKICHKLVSKYNSAHKENPIQASTIHSAQGSEADAVIFVLNPGSLRSVGDDLYATGSIAHFNNPNILNVGISRAKESLIVLHPKEKFEITPPYAEYEFTRNILKTGIEGLSHEKIPAEKIESLLFGNVQIQHFTQVESLTSFDFYYLSELKKKAMRYAFLRNKANLNVLIVEDFYNPIKSQPSASLSHVNKHSLKNGKKGENTRRRFKIGEEIEATVSSFSEDGWMAFLSVEGFSGKASITKKNLFNQFVQNFHIKRIEDFLEIGQKIEARVLAFNRRTGLILTKKPIK